MYACQAFLRGGTSVSETGSWTEADVGKGLGGKGVLKDWASSRSVAPSFTADDRIAAAVIIDVEARQPSSLADDGVFDIRSAGIGWGKRVGLGASMACVHF